MPEILEVPRFLRYDIAEAFERRLGRPEITGKLDFPFLGIERDRNML